MIMIKNGSRWIDAEPFCVGFHSWCQAHYSFNLARHGSFSQITNTVISLLIQTGPSFSNSVDYHKAVKQSVTLVQVAMMRNGTQLLLSPLINSFIMAPHCYHASFFIQFQTAPVYKTTELHFKVKRHILTWKNKTLAHPSWLSQVRKLLTSNKFNSEYFS